LKQSQTFRECTFKPNISLDGHGNGITFNSKNMYERNLKWKEERERRLNDEREKREKVEKAGCPFKPSISNLPPDRP